MIEAVLNGTSKASVIADEVSREADSVVAAIDAVMASPLKDNLQQLKEAFIAEVQ